MKKEQKETVFSREQLLRKIETEHQVWDILVIGGGATGLGVALDSSSRGLKTVLFEQSDFAKGTSSRSTKLAHGGVRYLAQGNIKLVFEALRERGIMLENAPHLVNSLSFIIPSYRWWEKYFYGIGLKIYDWMAQKFRMGNTSLLKRITVLKQMGNLNPKKLNGGVQYYDGQFDDARLAINLAQTSIEQGGNLLNYMKVNELNKDFNGKVTGVQVTDMETGKAYSVQAKVVINATGVFVDDVLKMDNPDANTLLKVSQGIHLVLPKSFLDSEHALMIPATTDGRVLFAVPWHNHLLVGTTDTPLDHHQLEPKPLKQEINFILDTLKDYLKIVPKEKDVLSVFVGLRPLVLPENKEVGTKEISRDHKLKVTASKLITITGGKWTTYRKMAEDTVDQAIEVGSLSAGPCQTQTLKIHGYTTGNIADGALEFYGADAIGIAQLKRHHPDWNHPLHPKFPFTVAEVIWAVRHEMARTVDDILARRLRILFLNARAAIELAPKVAEIMAGEMGKDQEWINTQIKDFQNIAKNYLVNPVLGEVLISGELQKIE
ncbi:glycerol-3-phosphate dehydrogenase/oxidase [Flagellimonas alvinocaridis]|uniref:Glycerol-3-phosphate dehydrogenase/oxidase n=1 Tax=Flagellimonas alvinocaridis TaxID=2530200 RepID=A0A4S8RT36_9FLAO|nr:glycerol-3-phosphate dehydrogenase/oxidase [Allomuricauda alvinocaridis]THV60981.1 glycerol-3-phosphate dehydrogenase/oxidase [Allomuricauda alvinocaridis]